ncbi:methyl-accepting chemotaxis protein [Ideonella sp. DXS22W]|uniref:Methyl-accepting chemotaxis protein n=1 Tax=Pseudaquabacterium inlustre TaxID=2984192 RepID=A0ABU9CL94_9BURK
MNHRTLTVRQQLTLGFGGLALACLALATAAIVSLNSATDAYHHHVDGVEARATTVARLGHAVKDRALAARNMLLAPDDASRQAQMGAASRAHTRVGELLAAYQKQVAEAHDMSARARELATELAQVERAYAEVAQDVMALAAKGQRDAAIARMNSDCLPKLARIGELLDEYARLAEQVGEADVQAAYAMLQWQRSLLMGVAALAVTGALWGGWRITRRLTDALGAEPAALGQALGRMADGDLRPVPHAAGVPDGSVMASLARMQGSLVGLIGQVRVSADSIATASAQIATGNQDLSGRTESQASALQQTAAQMMQMTDTVRGNAASARTASDLAAEAAKVARQGGEVVARVVDTMGEISESSRRIADIIGTIDGIAFQTNILALNAAVEAARAGDQGRGFAVVAGEVRALARRSAEAAKEIKGLIDTSVQRVEAGSQQVGDAGDTMRRIVDQVGRVTDLIGEIHTATVEQSTGIEQVNQAVSALDNGTQQNAALVEQSAAAADSLRQQAQYMTQAVSVFRLGTAEPAV